MSQPIPRVLSLALVALVATAAAAADVAAVAPETEATDRTVGIGERVAAHARRLAEQGPRPAAGAEEAATAEDLGRRLGEIGLEVTVEPFTFGDFEVASVELVLAGGTVEPVALGIDPFQGPLELSGDAVVLAGGESPDGDLAGRLVITDHPMTQLLIAEAGPAAVVCVDAEAFSRFATGENRSAALRVTGARHTRESRNVVATLGDATGPRLLVTAHLDAYRDSPGANDNGTGLGALVELARIVAAESAPGLLPVTLVAFGAEEVGAVGSRAYVERHRNELANVVAVVNLDTLGGHDGPQIGTDAGVDPPIAGSDGGSVPAGLRGVAWEGLDGRWRMLHPGVLAQVTRLNSPEWLETAIAAAAADTGLEPGRRNLISDHRSFTAAGIPATTIQSGRHTIHSPRDTPENLDVDTLDAAARLAVAVVERLRRRGPAA